jgi:Mg-chelatase subunit ChlI
LVFLRSVHWLLVTASVVPSSPISCHPDEGGAKFLRNSALTRATRRNIPEDTILHSHRCENLKSYMVMVCSWSYQLVFLRNMRQLLVTASVVPSSPISCHPDEGGTTFLRNVGSYKSHMA